jgi:hypothetical protein
MGIGCLNCQYSVGRDGYFNDLIAKVGNRVAKVVGADLMGVERDLDALRVSVGSDFADTVPVVECVRNPILTASSGRRRTRPFRGPAAPSQ